MRVARRGGKEIFCPTDRPGVNTDGSSDKVVVLILMFGLVWIVCFVGGGYQSCWLIVNLCREGMSYNFFFFSDEVSLISRVILPTLIT